MSVMKTKILQMGSDIISEYHPGKPGSLTDSEGSTKQIKLENKRNSLLVATSISLLNDQHLADFQNEYNTINFDVIDSIFYQKYE